MTAVDTAFAEAEERVAIWESKEDVGRDIENASDVDSVRTYSSLGLPSSIDSEDNESERAIIHPIHQLWPGLG